jgi:hypothetical protein
MKKNESTKKADKQQYYKEINDLHYTVATKFDECEQRIFDAQDAVGYSNLTRATKTKLLKKFQDVWADMKEIVDTIGRCGKVK